ncbi:clavesin-1 [Schistocerca nitens]|uniref:clavesin-1 n=1 Tax=Schistocerca nitens TaxID=7011 RepID=UPI0021181F28|nr:clavesin-1 [Schistocerca nitens]
MTGQEDKMLKLAKEPHPTVMRGSFAVGLEFSQELSPQIQEVARTELRENPDQIRESLAAFRDILREETDFKLPLDDDAWCIRFLRPCKYYPESAAALVKRYYEFKVKNAELYNSLIPSKEKNLFDHDIMQVLPRRDQHGRRILVIELGKKWKHKKVSLEEVFKGAVLYLEAALWEPETQVAGGVVIFDMDGLSLQQVSQFTPSFAKRIIDWLQDAVPIRVKGFHVVNQPYIFNMVFALFKPFLREKLRNRIVFHGTDRDSLHNYISPKVLPECYGGTLDIDRVTGAEWFKLLVHYDPVYEAVNSYGYKKQ